MSKRNRNIYYHYGRAQAVTGCGLISTDFMTKNDGNRAHPDRDGERANSYSVTVDRGLSRL